MGILSDLIRAPIGQAPSRGRGMGAIGARPDLPMPPKRRRKVGLAGLIQRAKDGSISRRLEQPISIGGIGGGIPSIGSPQQLLPPPPGFIPPAIGNTGGIGRDMGIAPPSFDGGRPPLAPPAMKQPVAPLAPLLPNLGGTPIANNGTLGDLPPGLRMKEQPDVGGPAERPGGPISIRPDLLPPKRISDQIRIDDRPIIDPRIGMPPPPLPPQDFGFGPGVRPTEIIGPDGQFIGSAGVTPPGAGRDPLRYDSVGMPLVNPINRPPSEGRSRPQPQTGLGAAELLELSDEELKRYIPRENIGYGVGANSRSIDTTPSPEEFRERLQREMNPNPDNFNMQLAGSRLYRPVDSKPMIAELPSERITEIGNPIPVTDPVVDPVVDPVIDPVAPTTQTDPTQTQMPMGAIDPVLLQQQTSEKLTDPLLRSLYFGTQDQPGFYQQLQQAGANLIGSDVPLQQTAGLTPLEVLARQQAISGIGGFEPFLQQNQNLVNQAIDQSVRAEELRDPYYGRAERQMQMGLGEELGGIGQARGITTGATNRFGGSLGRLGRQAIGSTQDYGGSLGESEDLLRGTLGAYDPGMTQQFYNPYEDAVVQQTIDDVLEAGDKQDIAARAREISSGAFGGSRARLGAEERRQDLGEGLAKALSGIRQTGYSQAQQTGLGEFARQREAERAASSGLAGLSGSRLGAQQQLGSTLRGLTGDQFGAQQQLAANLMGYGAAGSGARQNLATGLLGIGQQRGAGASALGSQLAGYGSQIGGIGQTQEQMRAGQRGELSGYGGVGRGIAETGLGRIYQQQLGQQQRPLGVLGQIGSMLPGYQASQTQIDSGYGMPTDPTAAGLGAAFSAYGALAPRQEGQG